METPRQTYEDWKGVRVPVGAIGVVAEIGSSGDVKVDLRANAHVNGSYAHVKRDEKVDVLRKASAKEAPHCRTKWIVTTTAAAHHVRKQKSTRSDKLGSRPRGGIVFGEQQGNWLALIDEPGFMLMRKPDGTKLLREFNDVQREPFLLTLHIGEVSPHGLVDVAITNIGGDEVTSIRADLNSRVESLRTLVSESIEDFASCLFMLPNGNVLGDDSARLGDVLEGAAVVGGDGYL